MDTIKKFTPLDLLNKSLTHEIFDIENPIFFSIIGDYWTRYYENGNVYYPKKHTTLVESLKSNKFVDIVLNQEFDNLFFNGFNITYFDGKPDLMFRTNTIDVSYHYKTNFLQRIGTYHTRSVCRTEMVYELTFGAIKQTLSFSEIQELFRRLEELEKIYKEKKYEKELSDSYIKLNERMS